MKKRWFAALSIPVFGLIVAWAASNHLLQSSEAVAFADKGSPKASPADDFSDEPVRPKSLTKKSAFPLEDEAFDVPTPVPSRSATPARPSVSYPPDGIDSLAGADPSNEEKAKLATLRERLAELTKAKAELINEEELTRGIAALEKQISDLHAAQKLLSAKQILSTLVEEFPDSPAALRAKRMLEAADAMKGTMPVPASVPKH